MRRLHATALLFAYQRGAFLKELEQAKLIERTVEGRVHLFRLRQKPLPEAGAWIERQQRFWNGALDPAFANAEVKAYPAMVARRSGRECRCPGLSLSYVD